VATAGPSLRFRVGKLPELMVPIRWQYYGGYCYRTCRSRCCAREPYAWIQELRKMERDQDAPAARFHVVLTIYAIRRKVFVAVTMGYIHCHVDPRAQ
jgi:hypothetical protein